MSKLSAPDIIHLVHRHFPETQVGNAIRVVWHESRYDTLAEGSEGEIGLFQIHPTWIPTALRRGFSNLFDPEQNAAFAFYLWMNGGWRGHWYRVSVAQGIR